MSEIVDRVALALFNHDMSRFTTQKRVEWTEQDLMPEHGSADIYRGRARLAIEAMREPTEAMVELFDDEDRRFATYCWDAFIAEALK